MDIAKLIYGESTKERYDRYRRIWSNNPVELKRLEWGYRIDKFILPPALSGILIGVAFASYLLYNAVANLPKGTESDFIKFKDIQITCQDSNKNRLCETVLKIGIQEFDLKEENGLPVLVMKNQPSKEKR